MVKYIRTETISLRMASTSFLSRLLRQDARVVVGLITLFGAVLRIYHLGYKPLWFDEAVIYWICKGNFQEIIAHNAARNSAPPLFALLLNLVMKVGDSENALRSISCIAGIAAIPASYSLSRKFMPGGAAYFCALVTAIALPQVSYSQQLREYSFSFLLATLMIACFYDVISNPNRKNWLLLSSTFAVAIFTQYGLALLILSLNIVFLLSLSTIQKNRFVDKKTLFARWTMSQAITLLAVIAVYFLSLKQQMQPGGFGTSAISDYLAGSYWDSSLPSLLRLVFRNTSRIFAFAFPPLWALLPLFLIGIFASLRNRVALLLLLVPLICTFLAACLRKYPYDGARQTMFLLPMIYVFAGLGFNYLAGLKRREILIPLVLLVVAVAGLNRTKSFLMLSGDEDIRPAAQILAASVKADDTIYIYYGATPAFDYYYRNSVGRRVYGTPNRLQPQNYGREIVPILSGSGKIWLVFSHPYAKEREVIINQVSRKRHLRLVQQLKSSWLYVAS